MSVESDGIRMKFGVGTTETQRSRRTSEKDVSRKGDSPRPLSVPSSLPLCLRVSVVRIVRMLFDLDGGALLFELRLQLLGLFLVDPLLHRLRSVVNQVLGLFQPERRAL